MKRNIIITAITVIVLVLFLLPINLHADPGNLITNGDFETGDFTGWNVNELDTGTCTIGTAGSNNYLVLKTTGGTGNAFVNQVISGITNTDLVLNYRYWLKSFDSSAEAEPLLKNTAYLIMIFNKSGQMSSVGRITHYFTTVTDSWSSLTPGLNIADEITSDFDSIYFELHLIRYEAESNDLEIWFDDVSLTERSYPSNSNSEVVPEPQPWSRDAEMTCYQVWINENNNFEFVFWWEYANNNWVKIYDMAGNEVFSIDMEYGNARFEAGLPDGMYTVKTFHNGFETPIQEFLIGKP